MTSNRIIKVDEHNKIEKTFVEPYWEFPGRVFPNPILQSDLPEGYFFVYDSLIVFKPTWNKRVKELDPVYDENNRIWRRSYVYEELSIEEKEQLFYEKKEILREKIKEMRKEKEYSGVSYSKNLKNYTISTDKDSQMKLLSAASIIPQASENVVGFQRIESAEINWKTSTGEFVSLTESQVVEIAQNVFRHIQTAFNWESNFRNMIDNARDYETLLDIEQQLQT